MYLTSLFVSPGIERVSEHHWHQPMAQKRRINTFFIFIKRNLIIKYDYI
jgi:hypothetical protein